MQKLSIYWSRKDFRLNDNPALFSSINYAQKNKLKLLPIYIIDEKFINNFKWNFGHPYRYYLSYALSQYTNEFKNFLIAVGNPVEIFTRLSIDYQLEVFANNEVEPYSRRRDYEVKNTLQKNNSTLHIFPDQTSISLTTKTGVGNFYSVFTPFKKSVQDEFINKLPLPKADLNKAEILNPSKISIKKIEFENTKTLQKSLFTYLDKPWILSFGGGQVNLDKIYQRPVYENFGTPVRMKQSNSLMNSTN
ncbi:deoxyribodipyrimidine photo-lyase [Candidatus Gracilibacteria bacterium]|nr:deoxyribodipyrimidine photo-lyase [Candidatus Gracilibacteria bacterium]